ncbi:hypothetical protein HPB47_025044 [Ixodes persulcatus]|uniref:Uncharacterized protein n=1 Tax=Ixodes persulcatus TaxID=34615 RepID=A0AC60Q2M8_IXOPE|nr:hypothetical protein HPB47_025044 [Ixodes persulcatus]
MSYFPTVRVLTSFFFLVSDLAHALLSHRIVPHEQQCLDVPPTGQGMNSVPSTGDSPYGYNSTPTQTFKDFLFSTLKEVILRDDAADSIQSAVRGYRNLVFT